jgi:hypothetical protein
MSGLKLYSEKSKERFFTYDQKASDEAINAAFFEYIGSEEVEVNPGLTKLPPDDRYANGMNWKNVHLKGVNSKLRSGNDISPYDKLNKGKPPINPKTGRRDGKESDFL